MSACTCTTLRDFTISVSELSDKLLQIWPVDEHHSTIVNSLLNASRQSGNIRSGNGDHIISIPRTKFERVMADTMVSRLKVNNKLVSHTDNTIEALTKLSADWVDRQEAKKHAASPPPHTIPPPDYVTASTNQPLSLDDPEGSFAGLIRACDKKTEARLASILGRVTDLEDAWARLTAAYTNPPDFGVSHQGRNVIGTVNGLPQSHHFSSTCGSGDLYGRSCSQSSAFDVPIVNPV